MNRPSEEEPESHPLAGVLDRLLTRERGGTLPEEPERVPEPERIEPPTRRMLAVAAGEEEEGLSPLVSLARWAARAGRRPVAVDFGGAAPPPSSAAGSTIPLATIPSGVEGLRRGGASCVSAVVDRLRKHEIAGDLLLVRIAAAERAALSRAAFLGGALVVPLGEGERSLYEAVRLSREILEAYPSVTISPLAADAAPLERFATMMREFLGVTVEPLDPEGDPPASLLERLAGPPEEGFLAALLDPGLAVPLRPQLLEIRALPL